MPPKKVAVVKMGKASKVKPPATLPLDAQLEKLAIDNETGGGASGVSAEAASGGPLTRVQKQRGESWSSDSSANDGAGGLEDGETRKKKAPYLYSDEELRRIMVWLENRWLANPLNAGQMPRSYEWDKCIQECNLQQVGRTADNLRAPLYIYIYINK